MFGGYLGKFDSGKCGYLYAEGPVFLSVDQRRKWGNSIPVAESFISVQESDGGFGIPPGLEMS